MLNQQRKDFSSSAELTFLKEETNVIPHIKVPEQIIACKGQEHRH